MSALQARAAMRAIRRGMLVAAIATTGIARADWRELYTVLGYEAGANHYLLPAAGSGSTTSYAGAVDASVYYGLTNSVHLGGRIRLAANVDARFRNVLVAFPDGTQSTGDVYGDHLGLGLGGLVLYRLDTGRPIAPVFEAEVGFTIHDYHNIIQIPSGTQYSVSLGNVSEFVVHASGAVLVEYRLKTRWTFSTGVGVQLEPSGGLLPWSVFVPFRVGRIWG